MQKVLATVRRWSVLVGWLVTVPNCALEYPKLASILSDGSTSCTTDEQCGAPQVCDLGGTMMCVQCTVNEHSACTGSTPLCVDHTCQKCTAHTQCPGSNVCMPTGSCADEMQVAYVQPGGSGSACTKTAPCGTLSAGVQTNKPIVKLAAGAIEDDKTAIIDGKAVMILADPGTKLARTNLGLVLDVRNTGADVQIFDLEITGGSGATNAVVSMPSGGAPRLTLTRVTVDFSQGIGVSATAGMLTISRSTIRENSGGGILIVEAQFDITNSYIVENGSAVSGIGGLDIAQILGTGTHRLDFNTIAANGVNLNLPVNTGVNCSSVTVPLVFDSNIIFGNSVAGGGKQIGDSSMCATSYSDVGPDLISGVGNINANPMFVNPAQGDFHLMRTSPAKDAANPAATLVDDADGDARPQGQLRDIGADEIKP